MINEVLRLENVCKTRSTYNLRNINLSLYNGEILAILEKSGQSFEPLIQLITGYITPDSGYIYFDEKELSAPTPLMIKKLGVYYVQTSPKHMPYLSISENLCVIDNPHNQFSFINHKLNREKTKALLNEFGLSHINPSASVSSLPVAMHYVLDILRCVIIEARILVIGDIFFKFSPNDLLLIIRILKKISSLGVSIILFANGFAEFFEIADRINVIRSNTITGNIRRPFPDKNTIQTLMTGFSLRPSSTPEPIADNNIILKLSHVKNETGLNDINFCMTKGEVVGLMDLSNNHCGNDVINILCAQMPCSGTITFNGSTYSLNRSFCDLQSIKLIPSINPDNYMFYNLSLMDNITIDMPKAAYYALGWTSEGIKRFLYKNALTQIHCEHLFHMFDSCANLPRIDKVNQLEILFARAICAKASFIVLYNPFDNYCSINLSDFKSLFKNVCALGIGILIISSNFTSLHDTCSRTYILNDGTMSPDFTQN